MGNYLITSNKILESVFVTDSIIVKHETTNSSEYLRAVYDENLPALRINISNIEDLNLWEEKTSNIIIPKSSYDTVEVPTLIINTLGTSTPVNSLGIDSNNNVVIGDKILWERGSGYLSVKQKGTSSTADAPRSLVMGYYNNITSNANDAFIAGGRYHNAGGVNSTIIGGYANSAEGLNTVIIGGSNNIVFDTDNSVIIGGESNILNAKNSAILGGNGLSGSEDNTVYVDKLNINTLGTNTSVKTLGLDSNNNVVEVAFSGGFWEEGSASNIITPVNPYDTAEVGNIILTSPLGNKFRLSVDDFGNLVTFPI